MPRRIRKTQVTACSAHATNAHPTDRVRRVRRRLTELLAAASAAAPLAAHASIFKGEALDKAADVLTVIVLILVPVAAITVFWMVHVIPEKIAERRHHPQQTAIKTLCLLSLVFGGMLWPIAWLWAYTKPVAYKLAYGTDKHDNYFVEACEQAEAGRLSPAEQARVREELDELAARGLLTPELRAARDRLAELNKAAATQSTPMRPPHAEQPGGAV